jgi:hypothetical protein
MLLDTSLLIMKGRPALAERPFTKIIRLER